MPLAAKYGIISDIHANYAAMKVALDYLQAAGVDKILCLGDLVGYGAEPFECIQAVKDKPNVYTIAGNHDRQVIGATLAQVANSLWRRSAPTRPMTRPEKPSSAMEVSGWFSRSSIFMTRPHYATQPAWKQVFRARD